MAHARAVCLCKSLHNISTAKTRNDKVVTRAWQHHATCCLILACDYRSIARITLLRLQRHASLLSYCSPASLNLYKRLWCKFFVLRGVTATTLTQKHSPRSKPLAYCSLHCIVAVSFFQRTLLVTHNDCNVFASASVSPVTCNSTM